MSRRRPREDHLARLRRELDTERAAAANDLLTSEMYRHLLEVQVRLASADRRAHLGARWISVTHILSAVVVFSVGSALSLIADLAHAQLGVSTATTVLASVGLLSWALGIVATAEWFGYRAKRWDEKADLLAAELALEQMRLDGDSARYDDDSPDAGPAELIQPGDE